VHPIATAKALDDGLVVFTGILAGALDWVISTERADEHNLIGDSWDANASAMAEESALLAWHKKTGILTFPANTAKAN
jgi:hypothetical protein